MKLLQYDHCPFCVRADMVANYKQIAHEKIYLLNDDEASCYERIGAKMVPILQFENGAAMAESLDIVKKLDELGAPHRQISADVGIRSQLEQLDRVRLHINCLLFPRVIDANLPEFATASAKAYFQRKKEALIERSFAQALAETELHLSPVQQVLADITAPELKPQLSMGDVLLYPLLRNLTLVQRLVFPEPLQRYVQHIALMTQTKTYWR